MIHGDIEGFSQVTWHPFDHIFRSILGFALNASLAALRPSLPSPPPFASLQLMSQFRIKKCPNPHSPDRRFLPTPVLGPRLSSAVPISTKDGMSKAPANREIIGTPELTELLVNQAREMKMLPEIAIKAIAVADDPVSDIQDLANIISQDLKLAASVLSLSNSPLFPIYATGSSISCLKMAITRLGFRQIKQMILVSSYSAMVGKLPLKETEARQKFMKHSFLTGCICTELNKLCDLGIQGEEFTAGIFHDIGRLLLLAAVPDQFLAIDKMNFNEEVSLLDKEIAAFGTTHADVGGWFLRRNQIPDELVNVAIHHHAPAGSARFTRLVALVAVADHMANSCSANMVAPSEYECLAVDGLKLMELLGANNAAQFLVDSWPEVFSRAIQTCEQILIC